MKKLLLSATLLLATAAVSEAQEFKYQTPPKAIQDLLLAPPTPRVSLTSDGRTLALLQVQDFPTVAELAQPELRLAGLRFNPRTNGPSRVSYAVGIKLKKLPNGPEIDVKGLPPQARISGISWSPDNKTMAFALTTPGSGSDGRVELWVADVATATARRLLNTPLNDAFGTSFEWVSDSKTLLARTVPAGRGSAPAADAAPTGPAVQESSGKKSGARTYQDLLKNPADERLFDYYATSQLVKVSLADGQAQPLGQPGVIQTASPSPDGKYVLLRTRHRPYSYLLPLSSFPQRIDVLDVGSGALVKTVADLPLADNVPTNFDAVATGPRGHSWRADEPATIAYAEAQDGGDPKVKADIRDKLYTLSAPFAGAAQELAALPMRFAGLTWGNNKLALADGYRWADRHQTTWQLNPSTPGAPLQVLFDGSEQDTYKNPGTPYEHRNAQGKSVLLTGGPSGQSIYLLGQGASPEGDRPFVDELNLSTKKTTRWWRSEAPVYEIPVAILDASGQHRDLLTRRESLNDNPNYFLRDATKKDKLTAVTKFANPYASFGGSFKKQVLHYKRADGVDLTADLYLPQKYKKTDGPLPTLMEAYPVEFKDKSNAGQVSGSPYTFTRLSWASPVYWVTQGYAVLANASIPIVGEGNKEPNDTYTEQLVSSAKAAIDEGARLGVVDANRVAVMGHSYGAFMTANLLSHSNLFKAGIARSGAYNRTLTPFGFQGEERTFWQAPEVYNAMSPFNFADKMKTPILLIHGEADNNSGTFPIQSERYYAALKGQGATARYVVLPAESHGYAARENLLHMLWEMDSWLNKYVKAPAPAN
ncbi:prolyl oligopeptidase family serine peptidase [Hymenobacter volaticus]|uniref:Prolyl oligopeptidase family serine peptidase n=1 Tax=Hymenobacter volaticus TaxID=2932254 RepID=A0ABY4GFN2_9BACT|nr:prolyl oligopeptidase family serine peptidase [Hymenobacter volaticus]UOQ69586.1 prolyl oligopeptidase family serine peptidase [Hymenobacter volaticus]